jgi:hypothetical protein
MLVGLSLVGSVDGDNVGLSLVGLFVGLPLVGSVDGDRVGLSLVGNVVGSFVGSMDGILDCIIDGILDTVLEGTFDGKSDGISLGESDGVCVRTIHLLFFTHASNHNFFSSYVKDVTTLVPSSTMLQYGSCTLSRHSYI